MPERYFTKGNETAGQLQSLIEAQTKLHETTNDKSGSVTQQTLTSFGASMGWSADQLQTRWTWLLAGCLSLIVLAVQIGLGSLSDGAMAERRERGGWIGQLFGETPVGDTTQAHTAKKGRGLRLVDR